MSTPSVEKLRAMQRTEKAKNEQELWAAIIAVNDALTGAGWAGIDPRHVRIAQGYLMRAGAIGAGDLPDDVLIEIAHAGGVRRWDAAMGIVYENEPVITLDGSIYICMAQHSAHAQHAPGSDAGAQHFRKLRQPPEDGEYLDFAWGERVPFGAVRRDPEDGQLYMATTADGVTLHQPLLPHAVPMAYVVYNPETENPEGTE